MKRKLLKILLGSLIGCFLIANITAIWIVSISSTATYGITSQAYGGLVVDQELSGQLFNSLDGSVSLVDEFIFTNEGDDVLMEIAISTSKESTDPNCYNWQNDCDVKYLFNGNSSLELLLGQNNQTIPTGQNKVEVDINCLQYSCPQNITSTININKLTV